MKLTDCIKTKFEIMRNTDLAPSTDFHCSGCLYENLFADMKLGILFYNILSLKKERLIFQKIIYVR